MISSTELLRSDSNVYSLILPSTRTLQHFTNKICGEEPSSWLDRRASELSLEPVVGSSSLKVIQDGLREDPYKDIACSNGILPNSVSTLCGRYSSPKISKFFKTAILTLGMDILTITMVKHDS